MNLKTWLRAEWDHVAGYTLVAVGAVLVITGCLGARNTPYAVVALSYIASSSIGGLFCLGLGATFLLSADLRDEWRKLDRIEGTLQYSHRPAEEVDRAGFEQSGAHLASVSSDPSRPPATRRPRHVPPLGVALTIVGAVLASALMVSGWHTVHWTSDLDVGARGVTVAVSGLALALGALTLTTLWFRSQVVTRAGRLLALAGGPSNGHIDPIPAVASRGSGGIQAGQALVVPGLRYYHRPGCVMLSGLEAVAVDIDEVAPSDRIPCGLCAAHRS